MMRYESETGRAWLEIDDYPNKVLIINQQFFPVSQ